MTLFSKLRQHLPRYKMPIKETDPVQAYNLWSESYDDQSGNLMLALDDALFSGILNNTSLHNKMVVDIGCGTGRHWNKILSQKPLAITGYDTSIGMLDKLKDKFPEAIIRQMENNHLPGAANNSCDIIISTLTVAHIENIDDAFCEWSRVLKNDGEIIITDYHPEALLNGGNRTFIHNGQIVAVKNYIHKIDELFDLLVCLNFELLSFTEKSIDDSMKKYYEAKQALHVFDKFKDVPIIYGMHLKKKNVIT